MLTYSDEEVVVEQIGSPIGSKVVKAKAVRGGVKVKAEGTPMELMTVVAVIMDKVMWQYGVPLHELYQVIEELIKEGGIDAEVVRAEEQE